MGRTELDGDPIAKLYAQMIEQIPFQRHLSLCCYGQNCLPAHVHLPQASMVRQNYLTFKRDAHCQTVACGLFT